MNKAGSISVRASWIVTAAILCGLVWFMRDSISAMMEIWVSSRSFNHCFLIAPASAVLIWRRRGDLARDPAVLRSDCVALRPAAAQGQAASVQAPARLLHVCDLWVDSAPAHQQGCEVRCAPHPVARDALSHALHLPAGLTSTVWHVTKVLLLTSQQ